ncbi:tRNA (adenosine(37)-N6)-threonylcarbamoyltransferase complex transferase subunit TsaD [Mycobacterium hackensackense]|uniref:tRNA (adenosine(37)-N6)-threonylcarbamoyltransferase complex transferase subunit TsaD n=1 Tax=Mycobacterium hackensackense TaxID=228909 RepID=UPI002265F028|nr:tRNA (adenosine(37)-N6)-threonylcarbamoyltransferase complex transferase subunit TsaD [Mycobacterium hackensackense]MCV7252291.1 tRNA (adenosine(37)-N6)-threonylcarbamoyltransferase complex transferase subunit TsaD [Mycobacterium hackensackense]
MIVLGFESSCDDTSVAVVQDGDRILSNIIASQHGFHRTYGGIVPSLASRQHARAVSIVYEEAMRQASISLRDIDAVAVTTDQGLALSLSVGAAAAKSVAMVAGVPMIGIHHVEGHIESCLMGDESLAYPFLCLTVAGGHTMMLVAHEFGYYELVGATKDDALGEVYDKLARRMGLGYPGGPILDRLARDGNPERFSFPRPMINRGADFSFSGLKSAVRRELDQLDDSGVSYSPSDVAASFQEAAMEVIVTKAIRAAREVGLSSIGVAGGVSANRRLRELLGEKSADYDIRVHFPDPNLCLDNAAMIAAVGYRRLLRGERSSLDIDVRANAPMGESAMIYKAATKYR